MAAHIAEPVKPPSEYRADLPSDLEAVVLRCLQKDPTERFADAASLAAAFRACACAGSWSETTAAAWWRTYHAETAASTSLTAGAMQLGNDQTGAGDPKTSGTRVDLVSRTLETPHDSKRTPKP